MGVDRVALMAKIENDAVAISFIQRDVGRIIARCLLRFSVDDQDDDSVGYGQNRLTKDGVTFELVAGSGIDVAAGIGLLPVDRVALRYPHASVDWKGSPRMANCIAAGVR